MAVGNGNRKEQFEQLDGVIAQWKGVEGGLLPIMQHAQEILGCVDEEVQHYISAATGIPVSTIYGVATFYSQFTLKPRGKYTMGICLGCGKPLRVQGCFVTDTEVEAVAGYVKDNYTAEYSQQVLDELEKRLGIGVGETTADGMFTLNATRCIGCCGLAPAMMVNDEVYGRLVPGDVPGIIEKYRARG